MVSADPATAAAPDQTKVLAKTPDGTTFYYGSTVPSPPPLVIVHGDSLGPPVAATNTNRPAENQSHDNIMPVMAIRYLICVTGIYPDRP
jgi:microcystin-dependent protein